MINTVKRVLIALMVIPAAIVAIQTEAQAAAGYIKVGYFTQWGIYRRNFQVKTLHTSGMAAKLTHINYAFGNVGADGKCFEANEAGVGDAWADYQKGFKAGESVDGTGDVYNQPLAGNFNQLKKLKAMYPNLKVQISLGGWTWSKYFSDAALTPASRTAMVSSCIDLYLKGNLPFIGNSTKGGTGSGYGVFDGIDLDWEWPGSEGNAGNIVRPEDKHNLTLLAQEFRSQLNAYGAQVGRTFSLTAFLPADPAKIAAGVEISPLISTLDFATIQGYDLTGPWNPTTGHASNLYPVSTSAFSVDLALDTYRAAGAPAGKLVMGIPYYGKGWAGVSGTNNGLNQASSGPARGTYEDGTEDYKKLVSKSGPVFYDPAGIAAWKLSSGNFWSYDTPQTIAQKCTYIKANGLGGAMVWSLDGDTANGELTTAIHNGL